MARFMIYPYRMGSEGAQAIKAALNSESHEALLIRRENSQYQQRSTDVVISWGTPCSIPGALNANPEIAINKKDFYERLAGRGIVPPFVYTMADARRSLRFPVLCRTRVEGMDGQGIVIAETPDDLVTAPLFVELINKTEEWRVHAGRLPNGEITIIAVQKKEHRLIDGQDPRIWTGDSAFLTFDHNMPNNKVTNVVRNAMQFLPELTFGGFDVVFDGTWAYVVEVNSAPMMTERCARAYAGFFHNFLQPEVEEPVSMETVEFEPTPQDIGQVFDDLNHERIGLRAIIEGYLRYRGPNNG